MTTKDAAVGRAEAPSAQGVETHGIDTIPVGERTVRPFALFRTWAGAMSSLGPFVSGALFPLLGLDLLDSVIIIVVCSLASFAIVGLVALPGPTAGTSTLAISRAAFGFKANRLPALFTYLNTAGWGMLQLSIIVFAADALLQKLGVRVTAPITVLVCVVAILLQVVLPFYGYRMIVKAMSVIAPLNLVFFAVLAVILIPQLHLTGSAAGGQPGFATVTVAAAIAFAGGGLGWANIGSDYTRYVSPKASRRSVFTATTLGGALPTMVGMILGAMAGSVLPHSENIIYDLPKVLGAFGIPYLLLTIIGMFAVNTFILYSSGFAIQVSGFRIGRPLAICASMAIIVIPTFFVVFNSGFANLFQDFLLTQTAMFLGPWAGVFLVDLALRRGRYDGAGLLSWGAGPYWRNHGWYWPGIASLVGGAIVALCWLSSPFQGPLSHAFGGSDLNFIVGPVVSGLLYLALSRRKDTRPAGPAELADGEPAASEGHPAAGRVAG